MSRTAFWNCYSINISERLRLVPDVLESLISEKRLLQAAVLLVRSMKTIKKQDMLDIGAVADLRAYFIGQESVRAIRF
jgi:exocyst complex component 4